MKAEVSDQFNQLVRAVDLLQKNLKCVICLELLHNPVQTRCRHSFCHSCINAVLKGASNAQCPLCNTHITRRSIDNDVKSASLVTLYKNLMIAIEKDCGINVESYAIVERDTREAVFNSPRHQKLSAKKPEGPKLLSITADGDTSLLPIVSECKKTVTVKEKQQGDDKNISISETPKRTLSLENVNHTKGNILNRYSKSYKSKHDVNAPELPVKKLDGVSCKDKVEHWLQINSGLLETGFNSPVSNTPELKVNVNFSPVDDDDLISASQVAETNSFVAPENPHKLNTIFKSRDHVDSANNKFTSSGNDPYTFIPSQPTKKPKGKNKITTNASRKGRKISEKIIPSSKDKHVAIGDVTLNNIFRQQIPESQNIADGCNVTVNDTFDNLFKDSKCPNKFQKNKIDMDDDVLLFKTPLDSVEADNVPIDAENLSDAISVSSGEDWPVSSKKQIRKTTVTRSLPRKSALSRKSTLREKSLRSRRKSDMNKCFKNNEKIELLKNEFEEVDKYKLVTSSQFDREQEEIKNMEKTVSFQIVENQLLNKSEKGNDLCKVNEKNNKGVPEVNAADTDCIVQYTDSVSKPLGWSRFSEVRKDFRKSTKPSLKALNVSEGSLLPSKNAVVLNDIEGQPYTIGTVISSDDVRAMLVRNRSSSEESLDLSGTQGNQKQFNEETLNSSHQKTNMNIYENDICDLETVILQNRSIAHNVSLELDKTAVERNINEKLPLLNTHLQNASGNTDESFGPVTHFETPSNLEIQNCVKNALSCLETINLEDCNKSLHTAIASLKSELQRKEATILHENVESNTFIQELVVEKDNCTTNIVCHKNGGESNSKKESPLKNSQRIIKKNINIKENEINCQVGDVLKNTCPSPQAIIFPEEFVNVDHDKRLPSVNMQTSDNNSLNLTIKFNFNLSDMLRSKNQQFDEISTSCNKEGLSKTRKTFSLLANTEDLNNLSVIHSTESTQDHLSIRVANTSKYERHNYQYQNVATQTHQSGIKPHCTAELAFDGVNSAIPVNIDGSIDVSQTDKGLRNIKANFWFNFEDHVKKQTSRNETSESQSLSHLPKPNQGTALTMKKYPSEESQEIEKSVPHKLSNLYTLKTNASQPVTLYTDQNNANEITESSENYLQTRKANGKHVEGVTECTSKLAYNENDDSPQLLGSIPSYREIVKETDSSTNCIPHHSIDMNLSKKVQSFQEKGKATSSPGSSSTNQMQKLSDTSHTEQVLLTASSLSNGQGLVFPCGQLATDSQISSGNKQSEANSCNENEINSNKRFNSSMSLFSSSNTDDKPGKGRQSNVETSKQIEENNPSYESGKNTILREINGDDDLNCPISNASKRPQCMSDDEEIRPNKKRKLKNVLCSDSEDSSSEHENKAGCYPAKQLNTPDLSSVQNTEDLLDSEEIIGKVMAKIDEELGLAPSSENYKVNRPQSSSKRRKLSQPKSPTMFSQPGHADEDEIINEKLTLHITVDDGDLSSQTRNKFQFTEGRKLLPFHQDSVQEEISVSVPESDDDVVERTPTKVVDVTPRDGSSDKPNVVHDDIQNFEKNGLKERDLKSNLSQQHIKIHKSIAPCGNISKSNINVHDDSVSLLQKNINNSKLIPTDAKNEMQENFIKKPSDLIIMCSGFSRDMPAKIKNAVVALGAVFSEKFLPTASHLIAKTNEQNCTDKTLKYLQAVASGKWIVNIEWIKTCVRMNKIVPEEPYEVLDSMAGTGPQRSRLSKEPLFKDFVFCCFGPYQGVTLEELRDLLFVCGALVVQSPIELNSRISNYCLIVVGHDNPNLPQLLNKCKHFNIPVVSHEWLLECISTYDIISIWPLLIHPSTLEEFQKLHLPAAALEVLDDDETTEEHTFS